MAYMPSINLPNSKIMKAIATSQNANPESTGIVTGLVRIPMTATTTATQNMTCLGALSFLFPSSMEDGGPPSLRGNCPLLEGPFYVSIHPAQSNLAPYSD